MSIWRHADWLHPTPTVARVTLGEGSTPLVASRRIGPAEGLTNLYYKLESCNPTGSYKDRFAAAAISEMVAQGQTRCIATSSGNTGAALAAYCAATGISCEIAILETTPEGKLRQMQAYGALLRRVRGFGVSSAATAATMEYLREKSGQPDAALQISAYAFSPIGMTGVQTLSYELAEQLAEIEHVFSPAGGGGLTLAVARGFGVLRRAEKIAASPRIECVQPAGNDTIATPLRDGAEQARAVECTSLISGLQVANVLDGDEVIRECRASGGSGHVVSDAEIWETQARLAREEGIFCEPAGAVALAGALQARREGRIEADAKTVCLVTGSGFKDPASVERMTASAQCPVVDVASLSG
jgi:threonine synthase